MLVDVYIFFFCNTLFVIMFIHSTLSLQKCLINVPPVYCIPAIANSNRNTLLNGINQFWGKEQWNLNINHCFHLKQTVNGMLRQMKFFLKLDLQICNSWKHQDQFWIVLSKFYNHAKKNSLQFAHIKENKSNTCII